MKARAIPVNASVAFNMMGGIQTQDRRPVSFPIIEKNGHLSSDGKFFLPPKSFCIALAPHQVGDILWVREPGKVIEVEESTDCLYEWVRIKYLADGHEAVVTIPPRLFDTWEMKYDHTAPAWVWKKQGIPNGIFKEAARTFLQINTVRIERIQDISEDDAIAEGVVDPQLGTYGMNATTIFRDLWESIYSGSWGINEWVWVYGFKKTEMPTNWPGKE